MLSLPFALRYLLATRPEVITQVLGIVYRAISAHVIRKAGLAFDPDEGRRKLGLLAARGHRGKGLAA